MGGGGDRGTGQGRGGDRWTEDTETLSPLFLPPAFSHDGWEEEEKMLEGGEGGRALREEAGDHIDALELWG